MINDIESEDKIEQKALKNNLKKYINEMENSSNDNIIKNNDNKEILLKFIENANLIYNNAKNLELFINVLIEQLTLGNNIIIPYLEICPILIKSYIDSDLDEEKELKYNKIFELLKTNSFISRENLLPIYEYFSELFYIVDNIDENDKRLQKFNKVFELWKIFYDFEIDKNDAGKLNSSYCFMGGSLKVTLHREFKLNEYCLLIKINFLKSINSNLNEDLILFATEDNLSLNLNFSRIKKTIEGKENIILLIIIKLKEIKVIVKENDESNESIVDLNIHIQNIRTFILLENFYGQIKSLEFEKVKYKKDIYTILNKKLYIPYPFSDDGYLCSKDIEKDSTIEKNINEMKFIESIKIKGDNLVKVNYINYIDNDFDLIDYFGGFSQFIPFVELINGIINNNKINLINGKDKKEYMKYVFINVVFRFCKILANNTKTLKTVKYYNLFFFSLILQLDYDLINIGNSDEKTEINFFTLVSKIDLDQTIISYIFGKLMNKGKSDFEKIIKDDETTFKDYLKKFYSKEKNPLLIRKTYKQLYKNIMKELFIYNRFWSNKELFFQKDKDINKNQLKLKYKQLSYYTKSYQNPLLYPILSINEYLPSFSKFDKSNLFKHDINQTLNYNFNFEDNILTKIINKNNPLKKEQIRTRCCLVKKNYHVKGEMIIIPRKKKNKTYPYFKIVFASDSDLNGDICNKINNEDPSNEIINFHDNKLCYGSIFPCTQKEFNRRILIKSKDIKFLIIRNYYRKTSAIEIFTYKSNKSYYFNFKDYIDLHNINDTDNILLKEIIKEENNNFRKFVFDNIENDIVLFFNIEYENTMFPLFCEKLNSFEKKINFYNNYDLLVLINLLSNRSFKDLYQYPIFPILYKKSNMNNILTKKEERDLSQHIGLQDLNEKSKARKILIEESYGSDDDGLDGPCLFNTHYSNPVYTCNFLIRVFPYSLPSIEFQGEGFDSPNRLFYSMKKTLENTLAQKSDLRELIPEIYYFPDLFDNKNCLKLGTLINGTEIDDVSINDYKEQKCEKYKFISELKNYLEFEKLKLNYWINLIFGKFQKKTNDKKPKFYYGKSMYIYQDKEKQKDEINNCLNMQKFEFGIQPFKLLNSKFPDTKDKMKYVGEIISYNRIQFIKDHTLIYRDKEKCFKCEGYNIINEEYIKIIDKKISIQTENYENFHYTFLGDVFGNIKIYKYELKYENKDKSDFQVLDKENKKKHNEGKNDITYNDNIINNYKETTSKMIKLLTDHYKQIKYIDYNPRLNLFLSYSLDGFINIYVFPKCKLVRAIKVSNITNSNDILEKVVLVSNPFPMIFTYDKNNMYTITLNGELIKKEELKYKQKLYPCIDKNCGLINDYIIFKDNENKNTKNKDLNEKHKHIIFSFPFFSVQNEF